MEWNRKYFANYFEIYLNVPLELVKRRDPKGIYKKFEKGQEKNIVGIDIPWHEPKNSDLVIDVDEMKSVSEVRDIIIENLQFLEN